MYMYRLTAVTDDNTYLFVIAHILIYSQLKSYTDHNFMQRKVTCKKKGDYRKTASRGREE